MSKYCKYCIEEVSIEVIFHPYFATITITVGSNDLYY